jgi:hypothetical protein
LIVAYRKKNISEEGRTRLRKSISERAKGQKCKRAKVACIPDDELHQRRDQRGGPAGAGARDHLLRELHHAVVVAHLCKTVLVVVVVGEKECGGGDKQA